MGVWGRGGGGEMRVVPNKSKVKYLISIGNNCTVFSVQS